MFHFSTMDDCTVKLASAAKLAHYSAALDGMPFLDQLD